MSTMKFPLILVATLACTIQAENDFIKKVISNVNSTLETFRPVKQVLYVGTFDGTIDVYDWQRDARKFVKNDTVTVKTYGQPFLLLMDKPRNRLFALEDAIKNDQTVEVLELGPLPFRKSQPSTSKLFKNAKLHSSGNFLLMTDDGSIGRMFAMGIKEDGSLDTVATYTPPKFDTEIRSLAFHPMAQDVVAVAYPVLKMIKFFRFDTKEYSISSIADVTDVGKPNSLMFSSDGRYMYVTNHDYMILVYEVDVTNSRVLAELQASSLSVLKKGQLGRDSGISIHMAASPSQKYLYVLPHGESFLAMFKIASSPHEMSSNGFKATGGTFATGLTVSPDGSQLLVLDDTTSIFVFNIQGDGTLKDAGRIEGVMNPTAMVYSTK